MKMDLQFPILVCQSCLFLSFEFLVFGDFVCCFPDIVIYYIYCIPLKILY